jgi:hypothetical protein
MTEDDWLSCRDAQQMMRWLMQGNSSERQLRLFGCACCRNVWDLLTEDCFREAVEVAEQFADGRASRKALAVAKTVSGTALERNGLAGVTGPRLCALGTAWSCTRNAQTAALYPLWVFTHESETRWEIELLHDIFGNPFRPVALDPSWLTTDVLMRAQLAYDDRAFHLLPELADALEAAGCHDAEVLGHCRGPGPHTRGCWVVDLILSRE